MSLRTLAVLFSTMLLGLTLASTPAIVPLGHGGPHVYVDGDPTRNCEGNTPCFLTIQEGVDFANATTQVLIYPGTYNENVVVDRPITEITLANRSGTVGVVGSRDAPTWHFAPGSDGTAMEFLQILNGTDGVLVEADDVRLSQVTVGASEGAGVRASGTTGTFLGAVVVSGAGGSGIVLESVVQATLVDVVSRANALRGVHILGGMDITFLAGKGGGNLFASNGADGLLAQDASGVHVEGSTSTANAGDGVAFEGVSDGSLTGSNLNNNTGDGVDVSSSEGATLCFNEINDNGGDGSNVTDSSGVVVCGNTILTNALHGVQFTGVDPSSIENNTIGQNGGSGASVSDSEEITICGNSIFDNGGNGTDVTSSEEITICNNGITDNGGDGVNVTSSENVLVTNNTVSTSGGDGIAFWEVDPSYIVGNTVTGSSRDGVNVSRSQDILVSGNTASTNGGDGIAFWEVDPSWIQDNVASDNEGDGVDVTGSVEITIANNTVENNGIPGGPRPGRNPTQATSAGSGINVSYSQNVVVFGNVARTNGGDGIAFWEVDPSVISGNTVEGNTANGIGVFFSDFITVMNNSASTNGGDGIAFWEVDPSVILGNQVSGNSKAGVNVSRSQDIVVGGNTVDANGGDGIAFWEVDPSFIMNNSVTGNSNDGISAVRSQDITVSGNTASTNGGDGIAFWEVDPSFILDNLVQGNARNGIRLLQSIDILVRGNTMDGNDVSLRVEETTQSRVFFNNFMRSRVGLVMIDSADTVFDSGCEGGAFAIGNFWSAYLGQDDGSLVGRCGERKIAGDGIGDSLTPHLGVDYYPVLEKDGWLSLEGRLVLEAKILPQANNRGAKGRWVSVHITVPASLGQASDIDVATLRLYGNDGFVEADPGAPTNVANGPGETTLHVKFDRKAWAETVVPGEFCYAVIGRFADGTAFLAVDCITVKDPP